MIWLGSQAERAASDLITDTRTNWVDAYRRCGEKCEGQVSETERAELVRLRRENA